MAMALSCGVHSASALVFSSSCALQAGCSSFELSSEVRLCSSSNKTKSWNRNYSQRSRVQITAAKGPPKQGRGSNAKKAAAEGIQRRMRGREGDLDGWTMVLTAEEIPEGKNKAIIHNNAGYVLVKRDADLYCVEANCTTCRFPVIEGKVTEGEGEEGGSRIECPLCHSKVSLVDGQVVEYCPKDGILSWAVGVLKDKASPIAAKVYPARISNAGRVYVRFA